MTTVEHNETRATLIRVGTEMIARNGFNSTGLNAILSAAKVPKGSFYHYFPSKEDFGLAVIDDFAAVYTQRLERTLGDADVPPLQRVRNYFAAAIADMRACDHDRGCLAGNLGQELAGQNEAFRLRLEEIFEDWARRFGACFEEARRRGDIAADSDPEQLAELLISGWQGATLRAKVRKSSAPMALFADLFFSHVLRPPQT